MKKVIIKYSDYKDIYDSLFRDWSIIDAKPGAGAKPGMNEENIYLLSRKYVNIHRNCSRIVSKFENGVRPSASEFKYIKVCLTWELEYREIYYFNSGIGCKDLGTYNLMRDMDRIYLKFLGLLKRLYILFF